jgi:quercetin 2,3-dioxygenase
MKDPGKTPGSFFIKSISMGKIIHKAEDRGFADHGWLKAAHSFSFANFYDERKIHFGKLRVLNDDIVAPSKGFDMHPHKDMEIITIPQSGALKHADNLGNEAIIATGEVQVMSAGTGVYHSEFNASDTDPVNLFQIWIFTDQAGHRPRYEQKFFSPEGRNGKWQLLVSPDGRNESLRIHQNAFVSVIDSNGLADIQYKIHSPGNGIYFMVSDGTAEIAENLLEKRDAAGFWAFSEPLKIRFKQPSGLLAIEVPMH